MPTDEDSSSKHLPLNSLSSHDESTDETDEDDGGKGGRERARGRVSLLRLLCRTFGVELVFVQLWQLCHDVFLLSNPFLVGSVGLSVMCVCVCVVCVCVCVCVCGCGCGCVFGGWV